MLSTLVLHLDNRLYKESYVVLCSDSLDTVKINSGIRESVMDVKDHHHLNQGSSDLEVLENPPS